MSWIQLLLSFEGRISRRGYWLRFWLPLLGARLVLNALLPPDAFVNMLRLETALARPYAIPTPRFYALAAATNCAAIAVGVKRVTIVIIPDSSC